MTKVIDQLSYSDKLFLTDGGLETSLVFHQGINLPCFAAFDLLNNAVGCETLSKYYRDYAQLARKYEVAFILEAPTWRASKDWGEKLGYSAAELASLNRKAIKLLQDIRAEYQDEKTPMIISGCIGSRDDGYNPQSFMDEAEAESYHATQIKTFSEAGADLITVMTMTYPEEAIGISRAAKQNKIPVAISFTVETDGKLPNGQTLKDAIEQVDTATDATPIYYMINCAHPTHFMGILPTGESWLTRIRGIRANASVKSHAELDESTELDDGDPIALASQYQTLKSKLPSLNVLGGCCGTDIRHVEEICKACLPLFTSSTYS